jgi:hypothetical protein
MYGVPDSVINWIFSLVGKYGFQFFNPVFYVDVRPPKQINRQMFPGSYQVCMGLSNTAFNGSRLYRELVPMMELNLVHCRTQECQTIMFEYGQDEEENSQLNFAFTYGERRDIHRWNPEFVIGELYHCFCCHPDVEFYLRSNFRKLTREIEDALFEFYVLGRRNALDGFRK